MKSYLWIFTASLLLPSAVPAFAGSPVPGATYPLLYMGGSLSLSRHRVRAALGTDEVVFLDRHHRIAVPAQAITEIAFGAEVRRRMGAAVLGVVPLVHLGATEDHYIGVTWNDSTRAGRSVQVVLKLSKGEYRQFLAALERLTGIKAVDTNQVPTRVRYDVPGPAAG